MITRILIAINVLAFIWEVYTGALHSDAALIRDGVLIPLLVTRDGQWWRIVTSAFLHAGLLHIGMNMLSLYFIGRFVEAVLRPARTLLIYMVALVISGLAVVYFSPPNVATLGASGAIFGLFGAIFAIGFKLGERGRDLIRSSVPWLILNLVFSFSVPGISWQAHVGGLISGFIMAYLIYFPPRPVMTRVYDPASGQVYESHVEPPDERN